jgi:hypothetical protein
MPKKRGPDRLDAEVARLRLLQATDPAEAVAFAIELIGLRREHRVLEPALAALGDGPPAAARPPLRARYRDLAENGDRVDQDCALRVAIVRALRGLDSRSDDDVAEDAIRTVQLRLGVDVAQALRAEGLLLLTESSPERADLLAAALLLDPHTSTFSGEPAVTAMRVLARRGQLLPIWSVAHRPEVMASAYLSGRTVADALAQAFASLRALPADLQLEALRAHLVHARGTGEEGEAVALVVAEAIVLNELAEGYGLVIDLLAESPNLNLYRYLVLTAARSRDPALRAVLERLGRAERDERKRRVLDEALGPRWRPDRPSGQQKGPLGEPSGPQSVEMAGVEPASNELDQ